MPGFPTNDFFLFDPADPTKIVGFDCSVLQTGTISRFTFPSPVNGILVNAQTEGSSGDLLVSGGGSGSSNVFQPSSTVLGAAGTANWTSTQNFKDTQIIGGISSAPPGSGKIAKVDLTGQNGDVASTNLTNATAAGVYHIRGGIWVTTSDATAGTATLTAVGTSPLGGTLGQTGTVNLNGVGTLSVEFNKVIYLSSGNITFSLSHGGSWGTAQVQVSLRCSYLG